MTAREYLYRAFYLRLQIREVQERIEELRHRMSSVGAIRYDKLNVQSSPDDPMVMYIQRLLDAEKELIRLEGELSDAYKEIMDKLEQMDSDLYKTILMKRYLQGKPLKKIAQEIHYSEGYVCILHTAALKAFATLM